MKDPLPFLRTDASLLVTVIGLIVLWYALRKSETGRRAFAWVAVLVVALSLLHNALWGTCGRWGSWNQDLCTEPQDR